MYVQRRVSDTHHFLFFRKEYLIIKKNQYLAILRCIDKLHITVIEHNASPIVNIINLLVTI